MGAAASSSNISSISNQMSINDQEACLATQVVIVTNGNVSLLNDTVGGGVWANNTNASNVANCQFNTQISAVAKAIADQTANSSANANLPVAADWAISNSSNVVDLQNDIEMSVNETCGSTQNVAVTNGSFVLNCSHIDGVVDVNSTNSSNSLACVMDLQQQADEEGDSSQTATAKATNTSILLVLAILAFCVFVMIFPMLAGRAALSTAAAPGKAAGKASEIASARLATATAAFARAQALNNAMRMQGLQAMNDARVAQLQRVASQPVPVMPVPAFYPAAPAPVTPVAFPAPPISAPALPAAAPISVPAPVTSIAASVPALASAR